MPNSTGGIALANPNSRLFSIKFVDADGELTSYPLELAPGVTDIEVNGLLDALGAISNASLYGIDVTDSYGIIPVVGNALNATHVSVRDQLVSLWKDVTLRKAQRIYVPSPNQTVFLANTDTPDIVSQGIVDLQTASNAALPATYQPVSIRFTQSRKINERVRF